MVMTKKMCLVPDCEAASHTKGMCRPHYRKWYRYGDPLACRQKCLPRCGCKRHSEGANRRRPPQECEGCGILFIAPRKGVRFCSKSCYGRWKTIRNRMSGNEFSERMKSQEGRCAICSADITGDVRGGGRGKYSGKKSAAHRDHNHLTGTWRGLLCGKCNVGLGHFNDDPDLLMAAAFYLAKEVNVLGSLAGQ